MIKKDHTCEKHKDYTEKDIIQERRAFLEKEGRFEVDKLFDSLNDEQKEEVFNRFLKHFSHASDCLVRDIYKSIDKLGDKNCNTVLISLSGRTPEGKKIKLKDPIVIHLT